MSDTDNSPSMVNVNYKEESLRSATAKARVRLNASTLTLIRARRVPKGDVLSVSKVAGIQAAKQTAGLIPLCHPIMMGHTAIEFDTSSGDDVIEVISTVSGIGRTGFEMEALVAASVASLNIYDMCKGFDRGIVVEDLRLVRKSGGKSGTYNSEPPSRQKGRLVAVCVGTNLGPKSPVEEGVLEKELGLTGDIHAGTVRQVSLLSVEMIRRFTSALEGLNPLMMASSGVQVRPGYSGENLVTEGIDLANLPLGTRLRVGGQALLEVMQIGKQFHKPGYYLLPLAGVFARVVESGTVRGGDEVVVSEPA